MRTRAKPAASATPVAADRPLSEADRKVLMWRLARRYHRDRDAANAADSREVRAFVLDTLA